ncbi:hypothetical protein COU57_05785 [Candidatus Pacearchaeota archaeon CG10_big_fil_rev_8_21_14_0_10_32_14]|nr:MAG: hypothetical protein COU57_05785 [Candidatus Pacearchaeota archaeon CG10_big_fil_rev_8_21_14_0_10_32_14]
MGLVEKLRNVSLTLGLAGSLVYGWNYSQSSHGIDLNQNSKTQITEKLNHDSYIKKVNSIKDTSGNEVFTKEDSESLYSNRIEIQDLISLKEFSKDFGFYPYRASDLIFLEEENVLLDYTKQSLEETIKNSKLPFDSYSLSRFYLMGIEPKNIFFEDTPKPNAFISLPRWDPGEIGFWNSDSIKFYKNILKNYDVLARVMFYDTDYFQTRDKMRKEGVHFDFNLICGHGSRKDITFDAREMGKKPIPAPDLSFLFGYGFNLASPPIFDHLYQLDPCLFSVPIYDSYPSQVLEFNDKSSILEDMKNDRYYDTYFLFSCSTFMNNRNSPTIGEVFVESANNGQIIYGATEPFRSDYIDVISYYPFDVRIINANHKDITYVHKPKMFGDVPLKILNNISDKFL